MNSVNLIGRMTKDAEVRYTNEQKAVANFTLAVDRGGKDKGADFPRIVAFGKSAEIIERYTGKGRQIGIVGRIQTGSYENKDGKTVYTTDIVAERVFLIGSRNADADAGVPDAPEAAVPAGFEAMDDDIPF